MLLNGSFKFSSLNLNAVLVCDVGELLWALANRRLRFKEACQEVYFRYHGSGRWGIFYKVLCLLVDWSDSFNSRCMLVVARIRPLAMIFHPFPPEKSGFDI